MDPAEGGLGYFKDIGRGNAKWSGLCVGLDRWLYCVPYNSSRVLAIRGGRGATDHLPSPTPNLGCQVSCDDPYAKEKEELHKEFGEMLALPSGQRVMRYRELCRRWHPDKNLSDPV